MPQSNSSFSMHSAENILFLDTVYLCDLYVCLASQPNQIFTYFTYNIQHVNLFMPFERNALCVTGIGI